MSTRADAASWYDHVAADVSSVEGVAAARAYHVSPVLVLEVARLIAGYIAAGALEISRADTIGQARSRERKPISARQTLRAVNYLEARGHIKLAGHPGPMRAIRLVADSDDFAQAFRFQIAQDSDLISPTVPI
jgi:hypothetical protein